MDALTSFIVVIIAITIQFSLYAIKRLQEPLEPNYLIDKNSKKNKNYMGKFWKNAEITNGRLAMIGFLALIINYGFFGWIIPCLLYTSPSPRDKRQSRMPSSA